MLGAIIGDMVGSTYEFDPIKSKDFNIFNKKMTMTDDSLLTLAVAKVFYKHYPINYSEREIQLIKNDLIDEFKKAVKTHPKISWGNMFYSWATTSSNRPYNSFGNGAAMRISPVGWIANNENEVKKLSKIVTEITHNHPEGIKGAESIAMCIYLARKGKNKEYIKKYVEKHYYPIINNLNFDKLISEYDFDETCQGSCPQAIYCFLISNDVESAIRNCIVIGGDCDTTATMAGAIAEAYYSKDKYSSFEIEFMDKMIEKNIQNFIKSFKMKLTAL